MLPGFQGDMPGLEVNGKRCATGVRAMKTGKTLIELATELERQASAKKDYIADTRKLALTVNTSGAVELQGVNGGMGLRATAHQQIASSLGIPKTYYDRMLTEAPDLLATNANRWLQAQPAKKLVRTLDNQVRAFLSDSYRPLDNFDLAEAVIPSLTTLEANVLSCEVTESRMYIKAVTPRIEGVVAKMMPGTHNRLDDRIQAGVVISNSEVGQGSLRVEALDFRLICSNGMIREVAVRKAHLGRSGRSGMDAIEDAREFFRDETRQADDRAFFLKVQDAVGAMFNSERFNLRINQYRDALDQVIPAEAAVKVVELTAKRFSFNDCERKSVLAHLIQGGDLSKWGLANAVTRAAQDDGINYDRSTEFEKIGGDVIELPASAWKELVKA